MQAKSIDELPDKLVVIVLKFLRPCAAFLVAAFRKYLPNESVRLTCKRFSELMPAAMCAEQRIVPYPVRPLFKRYGVLGSGKSLRAHRLRALMRNPMFDSLSEQRESAFLSAFLHLVSQPSYIETNMGPALTNHDDTEVKAPIAMRRWQAINSQ